MGVRGFGWVCFGLMCLCFGWWFGSGLECAVALVLADGWMRGLGWAWLVGRELDWFRFVWMAMCLLIGLALG